ncbi:MAG: CoA-acylating methylmalonate-semialdehyde dehydrogenase [Microthrixaceae bacterium]|nr:CoA-acylating methylmalonate-semialdehyde dehydrogenase [Microthrixaceae bacterium]MCO5313292.1 CoA-acylating methylmalonate-semialdehyde dehydrogenase [Microthrixaceae bacterium]
MERIDHWIGGKLLSRDGRVSPVFNPATGVQRAEVSLADSALVSEAVGVAAGAFENWRYSTLSKRAKLMFNLRELLTRNADDLARIVVGEHGKVLDDARGEVERGLECIEFACGIPSLLKGGRNPEVSSGIDVHTAYEPVGVIAAITPFNFPVMVPLWMLANAIACGNTVVLKPSERDPSASMRIAELVTEAGFPDGVVNVLHGDATAVNELLASPDVAAVSFVGSTPVARSIYEVGAKHAKRVQALGGAKNHMVVLPDADVDAAADAAISAGYGAAGERCMAISVIVAVGAVADPLVEAIVKRIPDVKIGSGLDSSSMMGPLITEAHRDRVRGYVDGAPAEGATIVVDGTDGIPADGFYHGCALLDHVTPGMKAYDDEIFGPVLSVVRVDTFDEALTLVNDNPYGNGTAVFTRDGGAAREFERKVQAGMVGINVPIPVPVAWHSFGGWKASIFGDSAIYGPDGIRFYTRPKVVTTRWPDPASSAIDLGFPTTD